MLQALDVAKAGAVDRLALAAAAPEVWRIKR